MARQEFDREDLLRDATALVERIELAPVDDPSGEHVIAGFRTGGAASFYFGADTVYKFNADGQLRRAYVDGLLFKASRGKLVSLARERLENRTQLLSRELTDSEQVRFLDAMFKQLRSLADALQAGQYTIVGQVPASVDVLGRVRTWLAANDPHSIANSPRAEV